MHESNKYDKALEYEIFTKKEYGFADDAIEKSKIIFDIGGHTGLFSKYCIFLNPGCIIHYFEPIQTLYHQAKQNIKNQNLILNNFGISAKAGQQNMYYNPQKTMQSSKFNQTFLNPKGESLSVQMQNLQEYCTAQNIDKIDFLKIDVEGMEYEIIKSMDDGFLQKIKFILIEFHLFDSQMRDELVSLEDRLSKYFSISKRNSPYSENLGYIFALCIDKYY